MLTNLILVLVIGIPLFAAFICLVVLLVRALLKYIRSKDVREEKQATKVSFSAEDIRRVVAELYEVFDCRGLEEAEAHFLDSPY